jgi:hypothetical protein
MKRALICSLAALIGALSITAASQSGCGSPLVGLECEHGQARCGSSSACFDLRSDHDHCGTCGVQCAADEMCVAGECTSDFDAAPPGDGGMDGSLGDGQVGEGGTDTGALDGNMDGEIIIVDGEQPFDSGNWSGDASLPPLCMGPASPDDCVCELGELICGDTCVDGNTDVGHCGECGHDSNAVPPDGGQYFCVAGQCVLNCDPPLELCGGLCIDLTEDPDNCGECGRVCESGLCENRLCLDATAGHVIVIGHDMSNALPAAQRLAGNAMFLPSKQTITGLVYDEHSSAGAQAGVQAAIDAMRAATGRSFDRATLGDPTADSVPLLLSRADVFVIVSQTAATDDELIALGDSWSRALLGYLARGGVIVLFDGGGNHAGTYQILQQGGMFTAQSRMRLTPRTVHIEAPADALASSVPVQYQAQNQTVGFDTTAQTVVVRDRTSDLPVVIHIAR